MTRTVREIMQQTPTGALGFTKAALGEGEEDLLKGLPEYLSETDDLVILSMPVNLPPLPVAEPPTGRTANG